MVYPSIRFLVRIRNQASLTDMSARVGSALNCVFTPAGECEGGDLLEAEALGLWLTLTYRYQPDDQGRFIYHLVGGPRETPQVPWNPEATDISPYIQGVLSYRDSPDWYVPDKSELLAEFRTPKRS